jgi:RNA-directed DNA polymerase
MMTGEGHIRTRSSIFWATHFGRRRSKNRKGKFFINFSPAVSDKAVKAIRAEIRSWDLHLRSDKRIEDLSRMFNPKIRGWLQYYGRYYRSALYPPMRQLDRSLAHGLSGSTRSCVVICAGRHIGMSERG